MLTLILFRRRLLTLGLFLLTAVSGCGAHQGASGGTTLTVWYSTDDPVERSWSQQLARHFEALHSGVQVRLDDLTFEDLNTKLQLALAAGDPPDVAYVTPRGPGIPAYVGAHRLLDLTADAAAGDWAGHLRPGLLTAYNRPFAAYGAHSGRIVAVPTSLAAVGVLYNRGLLNRLHLSVPNSLAAFTAALAVARHAGYTPIGIGNADGWLGDDWYLTLVNSLVPLSGLLPEQQHNPKFSFLRPPYLEAGRILQVWANNSYFTQDFGGLDAQEGIDQFFAGTTLFQLVSSSENAQILADQVKTRLAIGIFAFPRVPAGRVVPYSGYLGWVVPAAGHHPRQAAEFIDSLLTPYTAHFLLRQGVLPAVRLTARLPNLPGWQREYLQALDVAQPGVYLDAAPVSNLNATMEANVQLLLQGYEAPTFLVKSLQEVYHGHGGSTARIDGEF